MFIIPDEIRSLALDHLRVADKMLRLIHQLSHGPASCDHRLIGNYALQALSHLQAAETVLSERKQGADGAN